MKHERDQGISLPYNRLGCCFAGLNGHGQARITIICHFERTKLWGRQKRRISRLLQQNGKVSIKRLAVGRITLPWYIASYSNKYRGRVNHQVSCIPLCRNCPPRVGFRKMKKKVDSVEAKASRWDTWYLHSDRVLRNLPCCIYLTSFVGLHLVLPWVIHTRPTHGTRWALRATESLDISLTKGYSLMTRWN